MTYAEFRRHSEDRADYPDPEERSAHLLYVLSILLNEFIGGWCDGKKPLTGKQIAPWIKVNEKPRELGVDEAIAKFFPASKVKSKGKPKPVARPNLGRPEDRPKAEGG